MNSLNTGLNEQEKLEYTMRMSRIMAEIGAKPANIALLDILCETSDGSALSDKGIIGRVRVRFGKDAFSNSEIFSGLNILEENLWMVERVRPSTEEICENLFSPSWYTLTDFGRDVANFFKGMEATLIKLDQE